MVPQPPLDSQRFVLAYAFGRRRSGSFDFAPYGRFAQDDSLADPSGRFFRMTGGGSSTLRAHDATGGVDFNALRERYAGGDGCRIFLPDDTLASLLASFYRIDDRARIERMRLKALELVALLDATERPVWKTFPYCTHDHALALERALDLLGSNLDEDLALEDAARCANMGLSTFKQRFLHAYGLSPMAYRRQCRVEEGARLLAGSRESVASVAARVGYRNPSKFAAAFVERFGATPSAWRARG